MKQYFPLKAIVFGLLLAAFGLFAIPSKADAAVNNWLQGATVYPDSATTYSGSAYEASIKQLASTGANYVCLLIPHYQATVTSSTMHAGWNTPSDEVLRSAIRTAKANGLQVMTVLKLYTEDGKWHADIKASDRAAWFKNYGDLLVKYGQMAQQEGVGLYSIGTEMWGMTSNVSNPDNGPKWQKVLDRLDAVYTGKLTYGTQHGGARNEREQISFWPRLDYIGVSAYFPLKEPGATPEAGLAASWQKVGEDLKRVSAKYNKPILFTEAGYRSIPDSHLDPWNYQRVGPVDLAEQARNYEALFTYGDKASYLAGSFWWGWMGNASAGGPNDTTFTPQNKPAQDVLKKWYTGGAVSPTKYDLIVTDITTEPSPAYTGQSVVLRATVKNNGGKPTPAGVHRLRFMIDGKWFSVNTSHTTALSPGASVVLSSPTIWTAILGTHTIEAYIDPTNLLKLEASETNNALTKTVVIQDEPEPPVEPPTVETPFITVNGYQLSLKTVVSGNAGASLPGRLRIIAPTTAADVAIDIEIYNSDWQKVAQTVYDHQNLSDGLEKAYDFNWMPAVAGQYHIKIGIFNGDWQQNIVWHSFDEPVITVTP